MTKFLFVRHGEADYSPIDERGFIGQGRSLAPLSALGIAQIEKTSCDLRLEKSQIILSSPYTRALQSAAIISKKLNLDIVVEVDLHEWVPDIVTFQYKTSEDCSVLYDDFNVHQGIHPISEPKVWESFDRMKKRMDRVLEKYQTYNQVIVVCHGMVIKTQKNQEKIENGEIIEVLKNFN